MSFLQYRLPLLNCQRSLRWGPFSIRRHLQLSSHLLKNQQSSIPPLQRQLLSLQPIKPNDSQVSGTVFDSKGTVVAVSEKFPKWRFLRDHNLYPRDLRKIDTSSVDIIPNILVKETCILVNLLHIKALIEKDKIYVFDTADPSSAIKLGVLMYDLESKLSQNTGNTAYKQSYEHNALESIFINVMSTLETEFKQQEESCTNILNELENQINREKLRDLLIKSKFLTLFYQKAFLIRDVLDELLESDEDMAAMYLSGSKYKQSITQGTDIHHHDPKKETQSPTEEVDITDIEMLLETYYTQCDEFVQHSESLIQDIKSTEEIVNIILDANRNSLMLLELKVTIYTLGVTVATLLPAFYGMNLKNFIEESYVGFAGVVVFSMLFALLVTKANFRALKTVTKVTMLNSTKTADLVTGAKTQAEPVAKTATNATSIWKRKKPTVTPFKMDTTTKINGDSTWTRVKDWCRYVWFGKSRTENNIWTQEEKDIVWKWLTSDKEK
ncbi:similar to Saccharomyces cerevisiae YOR334W MRS2 Mitochondrial inner membrane Mg(2+) channel [Maudiozyma saulgeensis]|uniref:Magnesium transporter n=1 Tax=Maudiozyma saulgeensis TaxID=1789683 RepID=A0A1X7R4Z1_9SACH|nr:similar to Saccharomyces cerevisiae YOR334W MRS2 Mitochondrial inner membrane Mg(2+) channel [Kazachstania saulgeensis]